MSRRIKSRTISHTLFVTVRANFRIFEELPVSHRNPVYISRTLFPTCLLVNMDDAISLPSSNVLMMGLLGPFTTETERVGRVPCNLGVRDVELVGL